MSGEDALREALVRVLCDGGHCGTCRRRVAELLPVVLRYGRKTEAAELRAAAEGWTDFRLASDQLRDRADALTAEDPT